MKIVFIRNMMQTSDHLEEAIKVSAWCKVQGLAFGKDFDWYFDNHKESLCVRFHDHCEEMSSLFALKWVK